MRTINENTTAILSLNFKDAKKKAIVPTTCRYRLDDVLSGEVTGWTPLTVSTPEYDIGITANENRIINDANAQEVRVLTVEATYPGGAEATTEYRYAVVNLKYLGV